MTENTAFITGATGQDGAYLSELLLKKGYRVHGLIRRASSPNTARLDGLLQQYADNLILHEGDLGDFVSLTTLLSAIRPVEIYNLGAQSHVKTSFSSPEYTTDINAMGTLRLLEAMRMAGLKDSRFYQASTSEMFGMAQEKVQNEKTPFYPRSPYAVSKLFGYWIAVNYREAYNLFVSNGILFNHESPLRGELFVTRKITRAVAAIAQGRQAVIELGNLDAQRDWGHARDYVEGMWRILQHDVPDDFVLATGETHSVREFVMLALQMIGHEISWEGKGTQEIGRSRKDGSVLVRVSEQYFRPSEVEFLQGDATKAEQLLGWKPTVSFPQLVEEMVKADLAAAGR